jgi:hypothetical protein
MSDDKKSVASASSTASQATALNVIRFNAFDEVYEEHRFVL